MKTLSLSPKARNEALKSPPINFMLDESLPPTQRLKAALEQSRECLNQYRMNMLQRDTLTI